MNKDDRKQNKKRSFNTEKVGNGAILTIACIVIIWVMTHAYFLFKGVEFS